jgi:hypothetical protein
MTAYGDGHDEGRVKLVYPSGGNGDPMARQADRGGSRRTLWLENR